MEPKKNPAFDVHRKSKQYFLIGLCCSLGMTITAFQWTTRVKQMQPPDIATEWDGQAVIEVTSLPEPERPRTPHQSTPVATLSSVIVASEELTELSVAPETYPEPSLDSGIYVLTEQAPEEKSVEITVWAEKMPEPDGGYDQFYKTVSKHLKYPRQAIRAQVEGRVFVQFTVRTDGSVTDITLLKGIGYGCDEEALRVMAIPKWNPGKQRGKPVNVRMVQPLVFEIP